MNTVRTFVFVLMALFMVGNNAAIAGCDPLAGLTEAMDCKEKEEISSLAKAEIFLVLREEGWKNIQQVQVSVLNKRRAESIDGRGLLYFSIVEAIVNSGSKTVGVVAYIATYRRPYSMAMHFGGMEYQVLSHMEISGQEVRLSIEDAGVLETKKKEYGEYMRSGVMGDLLNEKVARVN